MIRTAVFLVAIFCAKPPPCSGQQGSPHKKLDLSCSACHTTAGWQEIHFDHEKTGFLLEGQHKKQNCVACHQLEDFSQTTPSCTSCHLDYHQGALAPDCKQCHNEEAWHPADFSHDMSAFPLWGAHEAIACVQCHTNEITFQFATNLQTCFDCHARDFGQTTAAVHLQAGSDCETCHSQDQWKGGHNPAAFEIRFGPHEVNCSRCHKNSNDYLSYTCVDCHSFPPGEDEHQGLDPENARCLDCHTEGEFDDFEDSDD